MREHPLHLLGPVFLPLLAVVVRVGPERRRDGADRFDAAQQVGIDERAVLDAVPRVGPRILREHLLVRLQHHVDRDVAVGVNRDAEVVAMRVLDGLVDLLLRHRQDAVVVGADIRRAHAHRALGRGAVGAVLHAADANPLVAEAVVDARGLESGERGCCRGPGSTRDGAARRWRARPRTPGCGRDRRRRRGPR